MGIFYQPPPPNFAGGQPLTLGNLNPAFENNPPSQPPRSLGGPSAIALLIATVNQPDWGYAPWPYLFAGNRQPYTARVQVPGAAVAVNPPPTTQGGPTTLASELAIISQPDWGYTPWPYDYMGTAAPYQARTLAPGVPGQSVDNPPVRIGGPIAVPASIVAMLQPDPWIYSFAGAPQPYENKKSSPAIPGQSADPPPRTIGGPAVLPAEVAAIAQPDLWTFTFLGASQPFEPKKNSPAIPGQSKDPPPFTAGGPYAILLEGVVVNQPDWSVIAWPYLFMGGRQPYQKRNLPPSIPRSQIITTHNRGYVIV